MTWRRYLQSRTRNPAWLWRMVIGILLVGIVVGQVVDELVDAWITPASTFDLDAPEPEPNPDPNPEVLEWELLDRFARQGNWLALWGAVPKVMLHGWRAAGATTLAILTGLCWLAFAAQAIQPRSRRDGRLLLLPVAAALGVLSIWPTIFLIFYQEHRWGLAESEELRAAIQFFVLGVGLREELCKFVCFLPLLPWCVRKRDELAALMLAGCVGIGFAAEENVSYIAGSGGAGTLGRLLTPAPFHMATTGLLGLAAYRACVWPRECGPVLIAVMGALVLAHGLYDSFLVAPALQQYGIAAGLIFVFLAYQFFHELRPKQQLRVEPVSLTANFLFCVSTVAAATFVYLCAAAGLRPAADTLIAGIVTESVMVYLFLREMPETMVTV